MSEETPRRMSITNLNSGDTLEAQFNPTEINEQIQVNWTELDVMGLSHRPLQYKNTNNHQFQFTMRFDALRGSDGRASPSVTVETFDGSVRIANARKYLLSLTVGPRGPQGITGAAPPRFLFFWPGLASLQAQIFSLDFKHIAFSKKAPARFDVAVVLKEVRDARISSEEVLQMGTIREPGN